MLLILLLDLISDDLSWLLGRVFRCLLLFFFGALPHRIVIGLEEILELLVRQFALIYAILLVFGAG